MNSKKTIFILTIILIFEPFLWAGYGFSALKFVNIGISSKIAGSDESLSGLPKDLVSSNKDKAILNGLAVPGDGGLSFNRGKGYIGLLRPQNGIISNYQIKGRGRPSFGNSFSVSNYNHNYVHNNGGVIGGTHQQLCTSQATSSGNALSNAQTPLASHDNSVMGSDPQPKKKMIYLVCAGRHRTRANAEKHIETLKLFGYSPRIQVKDQDIFLVVLGTTDQRPKAEKMKSEFEKEGLTIFIDEE